MLLKYALMVSLLAATPATLALPDGSPCPGGDGDCDSQLCEPAGATDATCQSRPSGIGTRCSPSLGQDQCIRWAVDVEVRAGRLISSGYCDSASLVCGSFTCLAQRCTLPDAKLKAGSLISEGGLCYGGPYCANGGEWPATLGWASSREVSMRMWLTAKPYVASPGAAATKCAWELAEMRETNVTTMHSARET